MSERIEIPADMVSEHKGFSIVSIRDMLIALGASDQELRDHDEKNEILDREPWRMDGLKRVVVSVLPNGMQCIRTDGEVDWSGTRFQVSPSDGSGGPD